MNDIYKVPVVINGVLQYYEVKYVPMSEELSDGTIYQWSVGTCLGREVRRILATEGHDRYEVKEDDAFRCQTV